jgi:hypothetical protein
MDIGVFSRKLWRHKLGLSVSLVVALVAALWSVDKISVSPPRLTPRTLEMATATTHVLIDTPSSIMIDLRQDTYSVSDLTTRGIVLGNVLASAWLEAKIAQQAGVPAQLLRIQAPLTPQEAAVQVDPQRARHVTDILKSNDQYRIQISANPEVPMLDIYAQAPTAYSAAALANASVDQLRGYLATVARTQATPAKDAIRLEQLGRASGVVINPGVRYQVAVLVFLLTFGLCCATVMMVSRIRAGWRSQSLAERAAGARA